MIRVSSRVLGQVDTNAVPPYFDHLDHSQLKHTFLSPPPHMTNALDSLPLREHSLFTGFGSVHYLQDPEVFIICKIGECSLSCIEIESALLLLDKVPKQTLEHRIIFHSLL